MHRKLRIAALVALVLPLAGCVTHEMKRTIGMAAIREGTETGFINKFAPEGRKLHKYVVYVPREYDAGKAWPMIVFLHGAGERGKDGLLQTDVGLGRAIRRHPDRFPCIVVMPQCPEGVWWDGAVDQVKLAVGLTMKQYHIDEDRIYLSGLSMGGFATWIYGAQRPDFFAALMPICGGGNIEDAPALASIPIWAFQGADDEVVAPEESRRMVEAVRAAGGEVRYTEFEKTGHNSWDQAYENPKHIRWLLKQRRNR